MRYITLKKDVPTRKELKLDYRKQIELLVSEQTNQQQQGFDLPTMRKAFRIMDAMDAVQFGNVLKLEDSDWEFLNSRVSAFQWPWADRAFERFVLDIEGAPSEEQASTEPATNGLHVNGAAEAGSQSV